MAPWGASTREALRHQGARSGQGVAPGRRSRCGRGRALQARVPDRQRDDHPNIVKVIEFGTTPDGLDYLTMEYLEGEELGHLLRRGRQARDAAPDPRDVPGRACARPRAFVRLHPSRPQARQHLPVQGRGRRQRARARLRLGEAADGDRTQAHGVRHHARLAVLHVARAGDGEAGRRSAHGCLRFDAPSCTRRSPGKSPSKRRTSRRS